MLPTTANNILSTISFPLAKDDNAHTKRLLTSRFGHPNTSATGPHKNIVFRNTTTSEMHTGVMCTLVGT